jgi:hypothetical protein
VDQDSAVVDRPAAVSAAVVAAGSRESVNAILLNGVSLHANREIGFPGKSCVVSY